MPIPLPRRADGSLLPAVLAGLLLFVLVVQLLLPSSIDLPEGYDAPPRRWPRREGFEIKAQPVILQRALFTPTRSDDGGPPAVDGNAVATAPLGGLAVVGMVAIRGHAMVVLRTPGGQVQRLPVGGTYQDWRLAGVTHDAAIFKRNGEKLAIPFGAAAPTSAPTQQQDEESEEQQ